VHLRSDVIGGWSLSRDGGNAYICTQAHDNVHRDISGTIQSISGDTKWYGVAHGQRTKRYDDLYNDGELGPTRSAAAAMSSKDT